MKYQFMFWFKILLLCMRTMPCFYCSGKIKVKLQKHGICVEWWLSRYVANDYFCITFKNSKKNNSTEEKTSATWIINWCFYTFVAKIRIINYVERIMIVVDVKLFVHVCIYLNCTHYHIKYGKSYSSHYFCV